MFQHATLWGRFRRTKVVNIIKLLRSQRKSINTHDNFDCSLGNLGRDRQSLEERCLLRTQTSVHGLNEYGAWSQGTGTSWGSHTVLSELVTYFNQVQLGEDEANVSLDVGEKPK